MSNPLDWKAIGRFQALLVDLSTLVRTTFTEFAVGIEIIPWLLGEGKDFFVEKILKPLGKEFLATQRVRVFDENTIFVNLGATPKLPFDGAIVETHVGEDWVQLQKRPDGLYVGNHKVLLYLSERQQNSKTIQGDELREELREKPVLHANFLDALHEHPHLIPEDWKNDEHGKTRYIFFWGTVYRNRGSNLYVRYLNWNGGRWCSLYDWLGAHCGSSCPAASLN